MFRAGQNFRLERLRNDLRRMDIVIDWYNHKFLFDVDTHMLPSFSELDRFCFMLTIARFVYFFYSESGNFPLTILKFLRIIEKLQVLKRQSKKVTWCNYIIAIPRLTRSYVIWLFNWFKLKISHFQPFQIPLQAKIPFSPIQSKVVDISLISRKKDSLLLKGLNSMECKLCLKLNCMRNVHIRRVLSMHCVVLLYKVSQNAL